MSKTGLTTLVLCVVPYCVALDGQTASDSRDAVNILRMLVTAEAEQSRSTKVFVELSKLVRHEMFGAVPQAIQLRDAVAQSGGETASIGNYTVTLVLAADGRRYQASVIQQGRCAPAWFATDAAVIYAARPLGCE